MATELGLDWQRMFIGSDWSHLWAQLQPTRNAFDAANIDMGLSRAQLQPTRYAFDKVQTDYSRWMISSSVDDSWRAALMRWPTLPEAVYVARLPEIERSVYAAARPEIISVAQQLRETYDLSSVSASVRWIDTPRFGDFFDFDFDVDFNLDAPLADGPVIPVPSKKPQPLVSKAFWVWVAGRPRLVRIVVRSASAGAGYLVGVGVGEYTDGATGALVGQVIGEALSETIEMVIEKHTRDDRRT